MEQNKKRTPNFTASESEQLLQLVDKYKVVIECKRTDTCTNAKRNVAWKRIEEDFNSQCPSNCLRSDKALKKKYLNLKREVKKGAADDKRSLYLTGGGPPAKKTLTEIDEKLVNILHEKQVSGMHSVYDSDVVAVNVNKSEALDEISSEMFEDLLNDTEVENAVKESDNLEVGIANTPCVESNELWSKYDPGKLKTPKNPKLNLEEKTPNSAKTAWVRLADLKSKWTEKKFNAEITVIYAEHEKRIQWLQESSDFSMKFMKEKHRLEMEILEIDLERKKKELQG